MAHERAKLAALITQEIKTVGRQASIIVENRSFSLRILLQNYFHTTGWGYFGNVDHLKFGFRKCVVQILCLAMETPHLPLKVFESYFEDVYEPSEDTFLLLDVLEQELNELKSLNPTICLEIGSGSGTVITSLAKALGPSQCLYLATDINPKAIECTKKCFEHNISTNESVYLQMIRCKMSEAFRSRISADIIIFNPPYVPTDENAEKVNNGIEASWAGGDNGRKMIDFFIEKTLTNDLSPNGLAYLVVIEQNNIKDIIDLANVNGLECNRIMQRKCAIEKLSVLKFHCKSPKVP